MPCYRHSLSGAGRPGFQKCRKLPVRLSRGVALSRELGRPAFGNAANYSSCPPELPLPLANWAARLAQGPRDTQNLNAPGRYLRHFAGPECLPRGREATLLPETVIRIEGVNKNRRAAAARARTTEQPLVDRAPPGALNHLNLNV